MISTGRDLAETPPLAGVVRRFLPELRPDRRAIAAAVTLAVVAAGASALVAPLVGAATDAVLAGDRTGLLRATGLVAAAVLVRFVTDGAGQVRLVAAAERVVRRLRDRLAEHLAGAPLRFVERHRGGDLVTRATTELETLSTFVRSQLPGVVTVAGYLGVSLVVLVVISWQLTLVTGVLFLPATYVLTRRFGRRSAAAFGDEAATHATVEATFAESIDARETLQLCRAEDRWRERYAADNDRLLAAIGRTIRALLLFPVLYVVEGVTVAGILLAGGWLVRSGAITVGTVVVFVVAADRLFDSVVDATGLVGQLQESRVSIARLLDLLDATGPLPADDAANARPGPPVHGDLVIDGVGYAYVAGEPVLHAITATVSTGTRVALTGRTGSGKTTLAKVVTGLYRPGTGAVRFDGRDVHTLPVAELRRHIALVPQAVHLVPGSLLDNVRLVPTRPDREQVEEVVATLGLRGWVDRLGGLDADLGADGGRLSAGERQLVGFVRAALLDPPVLVLDEATADLDPTTAALLEGALDALHTDRTVIVVAHRPATIAAYPRTLVLDGGHLVHDTAVAPSSP